MPDPPVNAIKALRIHAIELAHAASEVGFGCFDQEMIAPTFRRSRVFDGTCLMAIDDSPA